MGNVEAIKYEALWAYVVLARHYNAAGNYIFMSFAVLAT